MDNQIQLDLTTSYGKESWNDYQQRMRKHNQALKNGQTTPGNQDQERANTNANGPTNREKEKDNTTRECALIKVIDKENI